MKILYLCQDHGIPILGRRGCSTHVRETCHALQAAGHEVTILCSCRGDDEDLDRNLDIIEATPPRTRKAGYDLRNFWQNVPFYRQARRIVESRGIEVIYERFSLYGLAGTWLDGKYGLPRIVEINAFLTVEQRHKLHFLKLAEMSERHVARRAPALIVVSQPLLDSLVELGVDRERIFIMPMAVDVSHFRPDRESGEAVRRKWGLDNKYVVGYVGSLSGWHGISLLHEMAAQIRASRSDFCIFVIGGEPEQIRRHQERARRAGVSDYLLFAGSVPYQEVPAYINAMDVALVPDTNYWTCPTKMFEYQSVGIPTIAPKYSAILGAMDQGEEGLLFEPRNVDQAVWRILELADHPETRREMGVKARRRVTATHSWQHNIDHITDLYRQMLAGRFMDEGEQS